MARLDSNLWRGRKVLVTGHTGFKGSWLVTMLRELGSDVSGLSLPPETSPSHFTLLKIEELLGSKSLFADIRDAERLTSFVASIEPEIVIHMAAQPLVLNSYEDPRGTYETNVMGTLNVLEAVRETKSVRAVVVVTSDKAYENRETERPYVETDPMGGYDPYSSSKGCAEILTASYRQSFFNPEAWGQSHRVLLASARAGNVIGGGDWAEHRLLPDFARAYQAGEPVVLRNVSSIRPWQHVLEPLAGYLMLAERLFKGEKKSAKGWNFGPSLENCWTVGQIVEEAKVQWSQVQFQTPPPGHALHEAKFLMLDSTQARTELGWRPRLDIRETLKWTLGWYEGFIRSGEIQTLQQIRKFLSAD